VSKHAELRADIAGRSGLEVGTIGEALLWRAVEGALAAAETPTTPKAEREALVQKVARAIQTADGHMTYGESRSCALASLAAIGYRLPAETPTTVEWGVNVGNYPDGSISVMVATEQDARALRSRPAVKRNVGPWGVVAP